MHCYIYNMEGVDEVHIKLIQKAQTKFTEGSKMKHHFKLYTEITMEYRQSLNTDLLSIYQQYMDQQKGENYPGQCNTNKG